MNNSFVRTTTIIYTKKKKDLKYNEFLFYNVMWAQVHNILFWCVRRNKLCGYSMKYTYDKTLYYIIIIKRRVLL